MKHTVSRNSRSLATKVGWSATFLFASATMSTAQYAQYGVRSEAGTDWVYIETPSGQELISAPLITPIDGYVDLGLGLAPVGGQAPVMRLDGLFSAGSTNVLSIEGARPNAELILFVGLSDAYIDGLGGTLVPSPDISITLYSDANGEASYTSVLPPNWPLDTDIWAQFVVIDPDGPQGFTTSNAIRCNGSLVGTTFEDPSRMRILGFTEAELEQLEETDGFTDSGPDIDGLVNLLNGPETCDGANLWDNGFPEFRGTTEQTEALSHLSQHLMFLKEKAAPFKGGTWTSNGCTAVPDFNFKDCCDDHDQCYCIGGTSADRKACDKDLRKCIRDKGHPWLACIYYWGVRIFGKSHFNQIP